MDVDFKSLQNIEISNGIGGRQSSIVTRQRCVCYNHRNDCFPVEEIVNDLHHTFVLVRLEKYRCKN
jgi:hypothetical protein